jgi:hypothetical protein
MKKTILTMLVVLAIGFSYAQKGEIIYTDFEPDLSVEELSPYDSHDTLKVDLDQDGTMDFKMFIESKYSTMVRYVYVTSSWDFRYCFNSIYSYGYMDENDTIIPDYPIWASANNTWELLWYPDQYMEFIMGFRKTVNGENYYAWAKIYMYRNVNGSGYEPGPGQFDIVSAYCDDMAYCTIPDYPLHWGQTDFTDIKENQASAFATVHPNPTTGVVRIIGKDLKAAEVVNTLGQRVATVQGQGEMLQIDIANLPEGIYFVRITDEQGRKCVRKVVKE